MEFNENLIDHLTELAKLSFMGEEKEEIQKDLERIVNFMDRLKEVDTDGVEPLIYLSDEINVLREDKPEINITHEEALKNAPKKDSDYIRIPKVLDKSAE